MQAENRKEHIEILKSILESSAEGLGDAFFRLLPGVDPDEFSAEKRLNVVRFVLPSLWNLDAVVCEGYWSQPPFESLKRGTLVSAMQRLVTGRVIPLVKKEAENSGIEPLLLVEPVYELFTTGLTIPVDLKKSDIPVSGDRLLNALALKNEELELADNEKDELISLVGRDLRSPLAAALGHVECIQNGSLEPVGDKVLHAGGMAVNNLRKLVEILNDLQDYITARLWIRKGFGNVGNFNLKELFSELEEDCSAEFARRKQEVRFDLDEPGLKVAGKRDSIYKTFFNLLQNASRFSGDGAEITVSAVRSKNRDISVTVADNGPGAPELIRDSIFKPFIRNLLGHDGAEQREGTGLGLAVVETILLAHGCSIKYEDTPGGGASFVFDLPAAGRYKKTLGRSERVSEKTSQSILVIDDDCDARDFTSFILSSEGYDVHGVSSAKEGFEKISSISFDAMLVDITLIGMDGTEFCREVKSNPATRRIPVIMVSARSEEKIRTRAKNAGCDGYIVKPFRIGPFLDMVKTKIAGMDGGEDG